MHRLHRFGDNVAAVALVVWFVLSIVTAAAMFGLQSQIQSYFVLAGIIWLLFGVEQWRLALAALAALIATMVAVFQTLPRGGLILSEAAPAAQLLALQSMVNATIINAVVLLYALMLLRRTETDLQCESLRAEALLNVVFPASIARRLRSGGGDADRRPNRRRERPVCRSGRIYTGGP